MDIDEFCEANPDVWVACLEAAGVDNWCGYEYAIDLLKEAMKEAGHEPE